MQIIIYDYILRKEACIQIRMHQARKVTAGVISTCFMNKDDNRKNELF